MNAAADRISKKFIGAVEDEWQLYSNCSSDYTIGPPIGFGASSIVYTALYQPQDGSQPIPCALKVLDLDRLPPHSLRLLQNETQLMSLAKHPNVLRVRGTWMVGYKLYIAMRLMNAGSVADVMRFGWPGGLEEEVIRCILKQALEGINYLHVNGLMHRDVKAANLLVDDDGTAISGVATFLWDAEDTTASPSSTQKRTVNFVHLPHSHTHAHAPNHAHPHKPRVLGKRKSFVGTPCWMAPEVINGKQYDASADIWSFGITTLELTQGRAPRSRADPHTVLLQTVQDAPPRLDRTAGPHRYSHALADIVAMCLDKDPAARPTAEDLLQMPFFRGAKRKTYLVGTILKGLPPLVQRQERRKQPSIRAHSTMDSWDFSTSLVASPTTSVYSHRRTVSTLPADDVSEMDNDENKGGSNSDGDQEGAQAQSHAEVYASHIRAKHHHHGSRSGSLHSRNVSWNDGDAARRPAPISEVAISSSPPSSSPTSSSDYGEAPENVPVPLPFPVAATSPDDLPVPSVDMPSTSPSGSSHSTARSSTSAQQEPVTPPQNVPQSRLWKRLAARFDGDKDKGEKKDGASRRKLSGMLGKTASVGAELARTASRTVSSAAGRS
ncbi:Serine/threonine-protein kinase fray2 [Grifola frondosa]|uniref:Serine/threonine-protein kinase fray2 n=1 Tax=Grifola frondosa TaxID=5627 RepID=A0A1C7MQV9_GRIFR|nr:Serine/threonine-protein kinase fray2 [Grifola frondosa]